MSGPHFCSMKISEDVRKQVPKFARRHEPNLFPEIETG